MSHLSHPYQILVFLTLLCIHIRVRNNGAHVNSMRSKLAVTQLAISKNVSYITYIP